MSISAMVCPRKLLMPSPGSLIESYGPHLFKGKESDIRAIGQHLGVQSVLEGSVRQGGRSIRISAKLIQTEDGFPLWSKKIDRQLTDLFAVQNEIRHKNSIQFLL
jgi:adenylate cyclase